MSTVEGYPLERIFHTAEGSAAQKTADSVILDQEAEDALPKFELSGTLFGCTRTYRAGRPGQSSRDRQKRMQVHHYSPRISSLTGLFSPLRHSV
jgi:hypothetical protein